MFSQPLHDRPAIVDRGRKLLFGCESVVERQHRCATAQTQLPAQTVMGFQIADGEAAAMQVKQQRQSVGCRGIEPCRQRAGSPGQMQVFDAGQWRPRQVEDLGPDLVGDAGFLGRQTVQRWATGAMNPLEQAGHAGGQ